MSRGFKNFFLDTILRIHYIHVKYLLKKYVILFFNMPRKLKYKLPPLTISNETPGQRIALFRKQKALTQRQLAKKIGITQTLVSDYETGRSHLSDTMIIRFALSLEISTDELLGLKNNNKNSKRINLKIMKRLKKLEELPEHKQKTILSSIDMMIDSAIRD